MALKDAAENLNTWQYTIFNRKKECYFLFQLNLSTMAAGGGCRCDCKWRFDFCFFVKKLRELWTKAKIYTLHFTVHGVLHTISNSKAHHCHGELSLSPMISICQNSHILKLAVQNGTLYKRLNSEIVYLTCSRPSTLKTIPCSVAHSGWGQIGEYPLAKLAFWGGGGTSPVFCQNILLIPP